jgi:hypothetical protein
LKAISFFRSFGEAFVIQQMKRLELGIRGRATRLPLKVEYFLLQYAPNPVREEHATVGLVVLEPDQIGNGLCFASFSPSWKGRVASIDPDADVETLSSLFRDIKSRLEAPDTRLETLELIDGFSNAIRVTEKRACVLQQPEIDIQTLVSEYL